MAQNKKALVQGGVTSSNGTALVPNQGFKIASAVMPVQPRNKKWVPAWHPLNPANNR